MISPYKQLVAARPDLAAAHLRGHVDAPRYAEGVLMRCQRGKTVLYPAPDESAESDTELLYGEHFMVYDRGDGFAWGQAALDGYTGYVRETALAPLGPPPAWRVTASSTFVYARANLKSPVRLHLPFNAKLPDGEADNGFLQTPDGFVFARHLAPLAARADDFVTVAERFIGVPYLWGGKTPFGFDCSGLIQTALEACGIGAPRDSSVQHDLIGEHIAPGPGLQGLKRGDLMFWKGHIGVMRDAVRLLHANAHHMAVASEPLAAAVSRIAANGLPVLAVKRLVQ